MFQILLLMLFPITSPYDFKCPALSQREPRAKGLCPTADQYFRYSCLFDANNEKYVESCEEVPDFVRPGKKYVIRGIPTDAKCSLDRYQPYLFYLNKSTNCGFLKSSCNGIGQLISANRTTKEDRTCRCDYGKGYDYVVTPKDKCHCVPSEEDCSCYRKRCPINYRLSPDYDCIATDSIQTSFNCTTIDSTMRTDHVTIQQPHNLTETDGIVIQKNSYYVIPILVICLVYIGICIICFVTILPKEQLTPYYLERQIIGNWKLLKDTLNSHKLVAAFEKNGLLTKSDVLELNTYSKSKRNACILICLLRNIKEERQLSNCKKMIEEQGSEFRDILNKQFQVRRWPKRGVRVTTDSGTIYSNCKGSCSMLMSVKGNKMKRPVNFEPWSGSCDSLMWLVRELALYPQSDSSDITAISLLPLAEDCCQRLHHSVQSGYFEEFLEQMFVEEINSSFKNQALEVDIIINDVQEGTEDRQEESYQRTPIDVASFNVISANRTFLKRHVDAKCLIDQLAKHGSLISTKCIFDDIPENEEKLNKFLEVLESNINSNFLKELSAMLKKMGYNTILERLKTCQEVYNANTEKLPQKIMNNLSNLCHDSVCNEFDVISSVFVERNILTNEIDDIQRKKQDKKRQMLSLIIHILKSGRDDAMLTLVDALYFHEKGIQLADSLLSLENDAVIEKDTGRIITDKTEKTTGLLFKGRYQLTVL